MYAGMMRRLPLALAGVAAAMLVAFFAPVPAQAATPTPAMSAPTPISASYRGWGYVVSSSVTVRAWPWMGGTWGDGGMLSGELVYIAPFSGSWSWAWSEGSWFAMPTRSLARWSCQPANGARTLVAQQAVAYRYNSTITMDFGAIPANSAATLHCLSSFPDAAVAPGTKALREAMALVRVRVPCQLPANPEAPACPVGGVDRWVYVKRSALV